MVISTKPGVQKPHWKAPASMKASCTGLSLRARVHERSTVVHLGAVDERREIEAARHGRAVHQHGAAAAQALPAAFARADQIELALQQLDEVVMRLDLGRDRLAVEGEVDVRAALMSSSSSGLLALARSARNTASAVSGSSVRRTPTASSMALAIAGDTPKVAVSPTPLAPNGPFALIGVDRLVLHHRAARRGCPGSCSRRARHW